MVMMLHLLKLLIQSVAAFNGFKYLRSAELLPGSGDYNGFAVFLTEKPDSLGKLALAEVLGTAEDYCGGIADLIVIELTEVFHIHFASCAVADNGGGGNGKTVDRGNGLDYVAELAHAGGLDKYSVGGIFLHNLAQREGKIANERAADAAGVELIDLNTRLLHKAAVDANLAELVFNEYDFLSAVGLGNELFYKCCFTGAEKAGENINFCH